MGDKGRSQQLKELKSLLTTQELSTVSLEKCVAGTGQADARVSKKVQEELAQHRKTKRMVQKLKIFRCCHCDLT